MLTGAHRIVIEGGNIRDIAGFYEEINRVFMVGESWTLGPSLDALNDMLYGGYGVLVGMETAIIEWRDMAETRSALGVDATLAFLEERAALRPMFNGSPVEDQVAALRLGHGKTYFDIVMDVFADHAHLSIVAA